MAHFSNNESACMISAWQAFKAYQAILGVLLAFSRRKNSKRSHTARAPWVPLCRWRWHWLRPPLSSHTSWSGCKNSISFLNWPSILYLHQPWLSSNYENIFIYNFIKNTFLLGPQARGRFRVRRTSRDPGSVFLGFLKKWSYLQLTKTVGYPQ